MFEFLIVMFGGRVFQQTVGIHMGTNRAPLLADLFHYSHKVDFTQEYLKKNEKKLAQSFNFTFKYNDIFLSGVVAVCHNGCNRMVVGFTTTCAISAYHH
jgi:hypothetical protein